MLLLLLILCDFIQNGSMNGSELLLNNAERYGLALAKTLDIDSPSQRLSRPNIGKSTRENNKHK